MGGSYERAITYLDRQRVQNPRDAWANATKAFLLFDREGLLAARRQMADGEPTELIDYLIDHFGESYLDISRWEPICSTVRVPAGASANHRAAAVQMASALGLRVIAPDAPAESGIAGECIYLEVRPMDGLSDMKGYITLHGTKGTVVTATDEEWLNAAVKRFIESIRQHNGQRQAPSGLATSFDLAR
jgi:hypothetical protein